MSYLLGAHGYQVRGARNGAQALCAAECGDIDLVLLDLQLPDMDGYQVLRMLRTQIHLATVAIVAVTAVAMVGDRERTLAAGFDHYMPKPINRGPLPPRSTAGSRPSAGAMAGPPVTPPPNTPATRISPDRSGAGRSAGW